MLALPDALRAALERAALQAYPLEACGLLVGREEAGRRTVVRTVATHNRAEQRSADHYEIDPDDFLRAEFAARAEGLVILGLWHSHPDRAPEPSPEDRASAVSGWSYLIVGVARGVVTGLASWALRDGALRPEPVVEPGAP